MVNRRIPDDGPTPPAAGDPVARPVPWALGVALAGVGVEVLALLVYVGTSVVTLVDRGTRSPAVTAFVLVFVLGVAALLVAAARALRRGARRARGPLVTWQLLQAAVAGSLLAAGVEAVVVAYAGGALALAVIVVVLLLSPPVTAFTAEGD